MSSVILRKFWLENESGDSIPLNGEEGIWLIDPTGLGVSNNSSFTNFSYGFFKPVEAEKDPQQTIAGDLYFIDHTDPYMAYRRFADWVIAAETLILVYAPTSTQFRRKIRLSYLTKTELMTQEALKVPIALYGLTPWYITETLTFQLRSEAPDTPYVVDISRVDVIEEEELADGEEELILDGDSEEGSDLPFDGEEELVLDGVAEETTGDLPFENDASEQAITTGVLSPQPRLVNDYRHFVSFNLFIGGQMPAGFAIQCNGLLVNPSIVVMEKSSGYVIGKCDLQNVTIDADELLLYSSDYENSFIVKQSGYSQVDLLNNVEYLTNNIYPKLPVGANYRFDVYSREAISTTVSMSIYKYYKGV